MLISGLLQQAFALSYALTAEDWQVDSNHNTALPRTPVYPVPLDAELTKSLASVPVFMRESAGSAPARRLVYRGFPR